MPYVYSIAKPEAHSDLGLLQMLYLPGITSLVISTTVAMVLLYNSDHIPRTSYTKEELRIKKGFIDPVEKQAEVE